MKYTILPVCLFLISSYCLFAQVPDIVKTEGVRTELQKSNVGKIFFTDRRIANEALRQTDFLNTYVLTNKSDLFFTAYFNNSLTNFKHRLAPGMSVDQFE